MALTRPVVPPDGSFIFGGSLSISCGDDVAVGCGATMRLDSEVLQENPYSRGFPAARDAGKDRLLDNVKVFHRISLSHPD
jgi:hypothetical protein